MKRVEEVPKKEVMSGEERAKLAKKLDEDLDVFIESLASQKKSNDERKPFDFDEWCRDLDQHPAFMTELKADEHGEYSEAVQALQALKYDQSEKEDRLEKAEWSKEEGNKHFRFKKYRWAIDCYTNGIKEMSTDRNINSVLFGNRAAANVHLGNLRSAARDCVFARRFDPTNLKVIIRCAECLIKMGYGKQCIDWIDSSKTLLDETLEKSIQKDDEKGKKAAEQLKKLDALREEAHQVELIEERDRRKMNVAMAKDKIAKEKLLLSFAKRKLRFKPMIDFDDASVFEWSQIEIRLPQIKSHEHVYLGNDGILYWPLLIQYPEYGQTDFLSECSELSSLEQLLQPIFTNKAEWDIRHDFTGNNVRMFICLDSDEDELYEVYKNESLGHILTTSSYIICNAFPLIQVYTKQRVSGHFEPRNSRIFRPK